METNVAIQQEGNALSKVLARIAAVIKSRLLNKPVDKLAIVRAQMAALRGRERALEAEIRQSIGRDLDVGESVRVEGVLFDANISLFERETLVTKKVREFLSPQQLRAATDLKTVTALKLTPKVRS